MRILKTRSIIRLDYSNYLTNINYYEICYIFYLDNQNTHIQILIPSSLYVREM